VPKNISWFPYAGITQIRFKGLAYTSQPYGTPIECY
jgi:hypothetical protein